MTALDRYALRVAREAKNASQITAAQSANLKKRLLLEAARLLGKEKRKIIEENKKDLRRTAQRKLSPALLDRLTLNEKRIGEMQEGIRVVAQLEDPVGQVLKKWRRPNGLKISKVTVPLGVIFIIYESRPNVTSECASLCLKSGNAVILRGGSEAFNSNRALVKVYQEVRLQA